MSTTVSWKPTAFGLLGILFVAAAWISNYLYATSLVGAEKGLFGDMFGAANALFSGMAFAGVVYAVFLQREELALAREEIRRTKQIFESQERQLSLQNNATTKQVFEATFFQLLRLLVDITHQIDFQRHKTGHTIVTRGKDAMVLMLSRLKEQYHHTATITDVVERASTAYSGFYESHSAELGHYFRLIYNIIKFVDRSGIADKKFYTNILRAQLSDAEVALLFHNGLSTRGREKLKPLMEKYNFLAHINDRDVLTTSLKELYAPSAFSRSPGPI